MIERYTRPEMGQIWSADSRFKFMLQVETAVAEAQAEKGIIPKAAAEAIRKKGKFDVARIHEIEKQTKHDVIAFVSSVAENVGPHGRYVHFGMTSSDVLDTATSLQIHQAGLILIKSIKSLKNSLMIQIRKHKSTLCSGRTHGMHAEPTTLGMKLCGFHAELLRNEERVIKALDQTRICKLSGAVGTYSAQSPSIEKSVAKKLRLVPETIATQVIPRDRHAELITSLALLGAGLERISVELRHLQRTEVGEVFEGFSQGQKGSSAMPHKKNPISSENITGCARLLRAYAQASIEDIALWHERDISHSSVERVIFPDAFILADYATDRMASVIKNLNVDKNKMIENMNLSQGQLFSSHVLLEFVNSGLSREEAYKHVQRVSHGLKPDQTLKDALLSDATLKKLLTVKSANEIFSGRRHLASIEKVVDGYLKKASS
ncbi:MAG: adenylosuccinate lyase [Bdellovibrionales bacterium]